MRLRGLLFLLMVQTTCLALSNNLQAQPPNAVNDNATTTKNTKVNILVLANDIGNNLEIDIILPALHGKTKIIGSVVEYTPDLGYVGYDAFDYQITDTQTGQTDQATVAITVKGTGVGELKAVDDYAQTPIGQGITLNVTANDMGNGIELVKSSVSPAKNGIVKVNADKTITYTPDPGFTGLDYFNYAIKDVFNNLDQALVAIEVQPTQPDDSLEIVKGCTPELKPFTICFEGLTYDGFELVVDPNTLKTSYNCSLVKLNDTCIKYTPLPGFTGYDTVWAQMCTNQIPPYCITQTAYIYVYETGGCPGPNAIDDHVTIGPDGVIVNGQASIGGYDGALINAGANDDDPCGKTLTVDAITQQPQNGTANIIDGNIVYIPDEGFAGTDILFYSTCNKCGECDEGKIIITVLPNDCNKNIITCVPPLSTFQWCPDYCKVDKNYITDLDITVENGGSFVLQPNGCYIYTPPSILEGIDKITIFACDASGTCETIIIDITIGNCGENEPPVANDDETDAIVGTPVSIDVTNNDFDPNGDPLTVTIITPPACGEANVVGNQIVYTATDETCIGDQIIVYEVCDPDGLCDQATVTIHVKEDCDFETQYCTAPMKSVIICVEFCDLAGSDSTWVKEATTTFNCSIHLIKDKPNCIKYTPLPGFTGTDTVYIIGTNEDGQLDTVVVYVTTGCSQPTANDDEATVISGNNIDIPVLDNDTDPCDNPLYPTVVNPPQNGSVVVNQDSTINYTPNPGFVGTDQFTYTACNECDDPGGDKCDEAIVTITVTPNDTSSVDAQPDVEFTKENTPITFNVLDNDIGDNLTLTQIIDDPDHGTIVTNPDGTVTYTPDSSYVGPDYFVYEACNNQGVCDIAVVAITIQPDTTANQPPTANNDVATTPKDTPVIIPVLDNDNDPDNDPIHVETITDQPENGTVIVNPDGTVTYTPNPEFEGVDCFKYLVCDDATPALCDEGEVCVSVGTNTPPNQPPYANDDETTTPINTAVTIPVQNNDDDPDGNIILMVLASDPDNGTAQIVGTDIIYTPNDGFVGVDYFTYIICDDGIPQLCDTASVKITVIGEVDSVDAQPDVEFTKENTPVTFNILDNDFGKNITITQIVDDPDHGVINYDPVTGEVTYTPDTGYIGQDYFFYEICNDQGVCDQTIVGITIQPDTIANQAPTANNDVATTPLDTPVTIAVLDNDSDPDNDPITPDLPALIALPTLFATTKLRPYAIARRFV
ncbi:MAG: Ig-like domain-containing protein [Bacteroidetes bacterium]|nr:Ig-like domain-containing protein [Bacteroidota bacterium]